MELFFRTSEKSDLQQQLDRDQQRSTAAAPVVEETPAVELHPEEPRPLFGKVKKPGFNVDLWGGWTKP